MTTTYDLDSMSFNKTELNPAHQAAVTEFENTVEYCVKGWKNGSNIVVIPGNVHERYGNLLLEYFQKVLIDAVGGPVEFTFASDSHGEKTFVQMPNPTSPEPRHETQSTTLVQTGPSQSDAVSSNATAVGVKKTPRPMNCWIIFRDAMYKQLKAKHPDLSVQLISTRCSEMWQSFTPDQKKPWQDAAQKAKEEHARKHPNYKYNPRKQGQKKKRQSRKAKLAAAAKAKAETFNVQPVPAITVVNEVGTASTSNPTYPTESATFFGLDNPGLLFGQLHDAESFRHSRLDIELGAELDMNMAFGLFDEGDHAFRTGADGDVTLPSVFDGAY